jgi:ABC-2 type transport system ATP-binding protein
MTPAHAQAHAQFHAHAPPMPMAPPPGYCPPGPVHPYPPTPQDRGPDTLVEPAPRTVAHVVKRRAKIKVLAELEKVQAALTGFPNVYDVSLGPMQTAIITYAGDEQVLASIVRGLVLAELPVAGVEPERNELERIFLEVTKGEVQ